MPGPAYARANGYDDEDDNNDDHRTLRAVPRGKVYQHPYRGLDGSSRQNLSMFELRTNLPFFRVRKILFHRERYYQYEYGPKVRCSLSTVHTYVDRGQISQQPLKQ